MASGGSLGSAQQERRIGGTGQSQGTGREQGTHVTFFGPIFFHEGRKDRAADRMTHVPGCELWSRQQSGYKVRWGKSKRDFISAQLVPLAAMHLTGDEGRTAGDLEKEDQVKR